MKISIDSNDLPAATRLDTWRGMLCDTYNMSMDCQLPSGFRSALEGFVAGEQSLTRVVSSRHTADRSTTLVRRDGLDSIIFGIPLAGRAITIQGGREAVLERGTIVISDTSRPFRTHVIESADVIWLSVPKRPIAERLRGIEDLVAVSFRPARPVEKIAIGLMAGIDQALAQNLPAHHADRLMANVLDMLAMTITSSGLPPRRPSRRAAPIQ